MAKIINAGVKLDETLHARLKALGSIKERTPHWLMKTAIVKYLEKEETYEQEKQEDMERWQLYKTTGYAIDNEAVNHWLQSIGTDNALPCPK